MKQYLRLLLSARWLFVLPILLLIITWEYLRTGTVAWGDGQETEERLPMATVREQQTKCKDLRKHLVARVVANGQGVWMLGSRVVEIVKERLLIVHGIHTTGEVLAKELRKAQRKGEIRKRIRPGTVYVEYTACQPTGMLLDNSAKHHGE